MTPPQPTERPVAEACRLVLDAVPDHRHPLGPVAADDLGEVHEPNCQRLRRRRRILRGHRHHVLQVQPPASAASLYSGDGRQRINPPQPPPKLRPQRLPSGALGRRRDRTHQQDGPSLMQRLKRLKSLSPAPPRLPVRHVLRHLTAPVLLAPPDRPGQLDVQPQGRRRDPAGRRQLHDCGM